MKMRIVGIQHLSGEKSKKSGKPYDFCLLHTLALTPEHFDNGANSMIGYRAETIMCDSDIALSVPVPCVADVYGDRFGRIEVINVLETFDSI